MINLFHAVTLVERLVSRPASPRPRFCVGPRQAGRVNSRCCLLDIPYKRVVAAVRRRQRTHPRSIITPPPAINQRTLTHREGSRRASNLCVAPTILSKSPALAKAKVGV